VNPPATAPGAAPAPVDAGEFSTFGWDTAFAVRIENVNAVIRARKAGPAGFDYQDPADPQTRCSGTFGPWQLVRGGDGGSVNVLVPMTGITGQFKEGAGYQSYFCAAASITVTVRLNFVAAGGTRRTLLVDPASQDPDAPVVEVYATDFGQAPVTPSYAVYPLQAAVVAWCTKNLADFAYIFSVADLNDEADTGAWAFLKPTAVSYAYVDGDSDADAFLGVLALTGGQSPAGLQQVLDTRIVQPGEEGAFCISRQLLLNRLILPQLLASWPNLKTDQLVFTDNAIQLKPNTTVNLPQTEYQGTSYTPQLNEFSLTCEGAQITVSAYTLTAVQEGVTAWSRTTARYTIGKGTNSSGETTLLYRQLADPTVSHGHYIDESVEITDIILAVVLALALAALVVVTDGAAAVLIAVVGGLIVGLVGISPQLAGLIEGGDAPAIDLLQDNIHDPMTWTDSTDFTVSAVDLDGSLRLGGSLGFGPTG
jgi:hypothetical protein